MDALSSWLNDERRGVTYSWVARELCVSATEAIALLTAFAKTAPRDTLIAHHLVCGPLKAAPASAWGGGGVHDKIASATAAEGFIAPFLVTIVAEAEVEGESVIEAREVLRVVRDGERG